MREIDSSDWYLLHDIVFKKKELFEREYKCCPRYIKLPEYIYREILRLENHWIVVEKQSGETLFGLKVCSTVSIEKLEDIDVF